MTQNRIAGTCLLASALLSPGTLLPARAAVPQTIPGLGTTTFPTSASSPEAQAAFMRGLLLLHLFEYPDAAQAFSSAQKLDPAFSMAYWGEAMTHNHGVWNQLDAGAGEAALDKFAPTAAARPLARVEFPILANEPTWQQSSCFMTGEGPRSSETRREEGGQVRT